MTLGGPRRHLTHHHPPVSDIKALPSVHCSPVTFVVPLDDRELVGDIGGDVAACSVNWCRLVEDIPQSTTG